MTAVKVRITLDEIQSALRACNNTLRAGGIFASASDTYILHGRSFVHNSPRADTTKVDYKRQ